MQILWFLIAAFAAMPAKAEWIELPWPALGATLPKPEPITPETPPAAPSTNPDRGPFFPPGTKVKPAR